MLRSSHKESSIIELSSVSGGQENSADPSAVQLARSEDRETVSGRGPLMGSRASRKHTVGSGGLLAGSKAMPHIVCVTLETMEASVSGLGKSGIDNVTLLEIGRASCRERV